MPMEKDRTTKGQKKPGDHMNLEEIVHLTNKVGLELCAARKISERLELFKATERAKAMEKYDDGKRAENKIKRLAEMDLNYTNFLEKLAEAKSNTEKLKLRYESFRNLFEARRSMLSYQKEEMKLY